MLHAGIDVGLADFDARALVVRIRIENRALGRAAGGRRAGEQTTRLGRSSRVHARNCTESGRACKGGVSEAGAGSAGRPPLRRRTGSARSGCLASSFASSAAIASGMLASSSRASGGRRVAVVIGEVALRERQGARHQAEERHAEGVEVGAVIDGFPRRLLGSHVVRRSADHGRGAAHLLDRLGQPEIHDLHHALAREEQVRRLDVAVHDPPLVRVLEARGDLDPEPGGVERGEAPALLEDARSAACPPAAPC